MVLGTTNISTSLVAQAIGLGSNDVGQLCIASSDNPAVPAFFVAEYANNFGVLTGELIPGKRPKWNIWSASNPGEWVVDGNGFLHFQLKRNPYGTIPAYIYSLGSFRGYNHTAEKPTLVCLSSPIRVIDNYIETTFRLYFGALYSIMKYKLGKEFLKFSISIDGGATFNSPIMAFPELPEEGNPIYIDYTKPYPGYGSITTMSGIMNVSISFYTDINGNGELTLNQLLKEEIYGVNQQFKQFPYVDNYDGAWVEKIIKYGSNNSYSDTYCNISGEVVVDGRTEKNGKILIPTGARIDVAFVKFYITKKSGPYTSVSFDIIYDGAYTVRHTNSLVTGYTTLIEPNCNNAVAVDGAEHYYRIDNITYA